MNTFFFISVLSSIILVPTMFYFFFKMICFLFVILILIIQLYCYQIDFIFYRRTCGFVLYWICMYAACICNVYIYNIATPCTMYINNFGLIFCRSICLTFNCTKSYPFSTSEGSILQLLWTVYLHIVYFM